MRFSKLHGKWHTLLHAWMHHPLSGLLPVLQALFALAAGASPSPASTRHLAATSLPTRMQTSREALLQHKPGSAMTEPLRCSLFGFSSASLGRRVWPALGSIAAW